MKNLILLCLLVLFGACSIDRSIENGDEVEHVELARFQRLPAASQLKIAAGDEPGEQLFLCLKFVRKTDNEPLRNQKVHFYHTSGTGEYEPVVAGDETTARLSGDAVTDSMGRIYIETILPGDYVGSSDNRHIHTTVFGAKPDTYDIHFRQYTSFMGKRFARRSDQYFLADLKKTQEGKLVAFLTMACKF